VPRQREGSFASHPCVEEIFKYRNRLPGYFTRTFVKPLCQERILLVIENPAFIVNNIARSVYNNFCFPIAQRCKPNMIRILLKRRFACLDGVEKVISVGEKIRPSMIYFELGRIQRCELFRCAPCGRNLVERTVGTGCEN